MKSVTSSDTGKDWGCSAVLRCVDAAAVPVVGVEPTVGRPVSPSVLARVTVTGSGLAHHSSVCAW